MSIQKVFVIESDVTNNAKPICNHAKLVGITEMSIDVHLLDSLIGSSMGRHGSISSLIRVVRIIKVVGFFKGFHLFDHTISVFRIIFGDPGFYTGGIEDGHGCKSRIKLLADRFGQINQVVEHRL